MLVAYTVNHKHPLLRDWLRSSQDGFIFSGEEILTAAELQLEDAGGVEDTR